MHRGPRDDGSMYVCMNERECMCLLGQGRAGQALRQGGQHRGYYGYSANVGVDRSEGSSGRGGEGGGG